MYLVQEAAKMSGVSVRTLHYYDHIGLLTPNKQENHYRYYSEEDLDNLQQILFYKYLGFPLKSIKDLMNNSQEQRLVQLKDQLKLLEQEEKKLHVLMQTLEQRIRSEERGLTMPNQDKFKGFRPEDAIPYREEAISRYGEACILASEAKQKGQEADVAELFNQIFFQFSDHKKTGFLSQDPNNHDLAEKLHQLICTYGFDCQLDVFEKIGLGYVTDPRFKSNLDKFGDGLAQYVSEAISSYVANNH